MGKAKTSSFVLTLPLKPEIFQIHILEKRFEIGRNIYNACLGELLKRYKKLQHDCVYQELIKQPKTKERDKELNDLRKQYGLSEYQIHVYVKPMYNHFSKHIDANTGQKIATRAWNAIEKLMFSDAEKVYFKKYGGMNSLEGKSNKQGLKFRDNQLIWNDLIIPVIIKKNDEYAQMALTQRIKYCRIKRKFIRGKYKYYLQLIIEGVPPKKIDKETGMFKHKHGTGRVGIDTSLQVMAVSSENKVEIYELAPSIENIEKQKRILQRKLDRQRRANNPYKYNVDGMIKRNKLKWIKSKNYIKTQNQLKELERKQADIRKMEHYILANQIIELGSEFYIEPINYKALQARSKEAKIDKNGKFKSKKRYGKSIANKAPAMFIRILKQKLKHWDIELKEINTFKAKASQYNHITDDYEKVEIDVRWKKIDGNMIQRDLYSAFLIMNIDERLDKVDREQCFKNWNRFLELHDIEVERLKGLDRKISVI